LQRPPEPFIRRPVGPRLAGRACLLTRLIVSTEMRSLAASPFRRVLQYECSRVALDPLGRRSSAIIRSLMDPVRFLQPREPTRKRHIGPVGFGGGSQMPHLPLACETESVFRADWDGGLSGPPGGRRHDSPIAQQVSSTWRVQQGRSKLRVGSGLMPQENACSPLC
jgi:hypothetical protein